MNREDTVTRELMLWMKENVPAEAIVAGDPVISSMIKLTTRFGIDDFVVTSVLICDAGTAL